MSGKLVIFNHPLMTHKLAIIRNEVTNTKDFRETVSEIEASIMVSYYRLLVALENDIIDFKEEYKRFVSLGRKMDTKGAFDMLKKEVDDIRRALKAKQKSRKGNKNPF